MESNETPINPYRVLGDLIKVLDPEELVRHRGLRQHARPDQHGLRGADPARPSRLGQRLHAGLQPGRRRRRPSSRIPKRQCVLRHRRRGRLLHDGQLRGGRALQDRHHRAPHQQRRLLRLRPGLLGRRPRSLHLEGVRPRLGVHGEHGEGGRLPRRGRDGSPSEIIPALKRALDENAKGRPAFIEFICSHHPVHGGWVRLAGGHYARCRCWWVAARAPKRRALHGTVSRARAAVCLTLPLVLAPFAAADAERSRYDELEAGIDRNTGFAHMTRDEHLHADRAQELRDRARHSCAHAVTHRSRPRDSQLTQPASWPIWAEVVPRLQQALASPRT